MVTSADTGPARDRGDQWASSTWVVVAAIVPAIAWGAFLAVASQLDEQLCMSGAAPDQGEWFGVDVRWPIVAAGLLAVLAILGSAAFLWIAYHRDDDLGGQVDASEPDRLRGHRFVALLGLVSAALFLLIVVASLVQIATEAAC